MEFVIFIFVVVPLLALSPFIIGYLIFKYGKCFNSIWRCGLLVFLLSLFAGLAFPVVMIFGDALRLIVPVALWISVGVLMIGVPICITLKLVRCNANSVVPGKTAVIVIAAIISLFVLGCASANGHKGAAMTGLFTVLLGGGAFVFASWVWLLLKAFDRRADLS